MRGDAGGASPPPVHLVHPAGSRAECHLHGAQVTSWRPADGQEWLFLSREARLEPGTAIRGGIPVIFPQFGEGPLPKHGFARTRPWELAAGGDGAEAVVLRLRDDDETRALWPHAFEAELRVRIGAALEMELRILNRGKSPFEFTAALHSYLRVADIRQARIDGLGGVRFIDKLADRAVRVEARQALSITEETDRIYVAPPGRLELQDGAAGRRLSIARTGFPDVVVWNPWIDLAARLPDFGDDEYLRMLCIEPAVAARPITLEPGAEWRGTQILSPD